MNKMDVKIKITSRSHVTNGLGSVGASFDLYKLSLFQKILKIHREQIVLTQLITYENISELFFKNGFNDTSKVMKEIETN